MIQVTPITEAEMVPFLVEVAEAESVIVGKKQIEALLRGMGRSRSSQARDVLIEFETFLQARRGGAVAD